MYHHTENCLKCSGCSLKTLKEWILLCPTGYLILLEMKRLTDDWLKILLFIKSVRWQKKKNVNIYKRRENGKINLHTLIFNPAPFFFFPLFWIILKPIPKSCKCTPIFFTVHLLKMRTFFLPNHNILSHLTKICSKTHFKNKILGFIYYYPVSIQVSLISKNGILQVVSSNQDPNMVLIKLFLVFLFFWVFFCHIA